MTGKEKEKRRRTYVYVRAEKKEREWWTYNGGDDYVTDDYWKLDPMCRCPFYFDRYRFQQLALYRIFRKKNNLSFGYLAV
jgi:hypothetical protein